MQSLRQRRSRLFLGAAMLLAAALLVGAAASLLNPSRGPGPLQNTSSTTVAFVVAPGEAMTWGADLPPNTTSSDIAIQSVDVVDPRGVEILGTSMIRPDVSGGIVTAPDYPPSGVETFPVPGAVITPSDGASPFLEVLTGVELSPGSAEGSISGLRIQYLAGGQEHELLLQQSLTLSSSAQS